MKRRDERVRAAAGLYFSGMSLRDVAEQLDVSASTVHHWRKENRIWADEWERLTAESKAVREKIFLSQSELVQQSSEHLGAFSLANLQAALDIQKSVQESLKGIKLPKIIETLDDLAALTKILRDITALAQSAWEGIEYSCQLEDFFKENTTAPEIEFSEFSPEEIEQIRQQN